MVQFQDLLCFSLAVLRCNKSKHRARKRVENNESGEHLVMKNEPWCELIIFL